MADGIEFDFSEVNALVADLGRVPGEARPLVKKAIQVTSINVKKSAAKSVSRDRFFKAAAAGIDFDITSEADTGITSEIGFNKERSEAAKLGNLREFGAPGSPNNLAPHNDLMNALEANQDDFQKGLEIALSQAEKKAGLG